MQKESVQFVPEWAKGIIWYQIFPERFSNGDPSNDPRLEDQVNSWPHDQRAPYRTHPWDSDWYKRQPYEENNGLNLSDTLQRRRYGGDLQGIINKLDYLSGLGVQALYLNPVFEAPSSHKYDAATWHHIDPTFGPDPDSDRKLIQKETPHDPSTWVWTSADKLFLRLIEEVHARGMFIIIDGVFNHMGLNSWVYQDIIKNQRNSPYRDWLKVEKWADETKDGSTIVKTWEGFRELPEILQDKNGIVEGPSEYIFNITKRWMDPLGNGDLSKGIDGWRLDVAFCIRHPFWKKWRRHVRGINPQAYLLAEVIDTPEKQKPYLQGDEFDAVMNYNFAFALSEYFIRVKRPMKPSELDKKLEDLRNAYPFQVCEVMHNLLGSHDTDRFASRILNSNLFTMRRWSEYYEQSKMVNPKYKTEKPDAQARHIQKLMVVFQMTYIGAPVIYYGDEAGLWGANDPCNRKPMPWTDMEMADEKTFPNGASSSGNGAGFDHELFDHYKTLCHLRLGSPALSKGGYKTLIADDATGVFGFLRTLPDGNVAVFFNSGEKPEEIIIPNLQIRGQMFALGGATVDGDAVRLNPDSAVIIGCENAG